MSKRNSTEKRLAPFFVMWSGQAAVVFLVFLAIILSSWVIVTDGENLSYF